MRRLRLLPLVALLALTSCRSAPPPEPERLEEGAMKIDISSAAFEDGKMIPSKYTCDGN